MTIFGRLILSAVVGLTVTSFGASSPSGCRLPLMRMANRTPPGADRLIQNDYLLRRTKVKGKQYHEVLVVMEYDTPSGHTATVIKREVRYGEPSTHDPDGRFRSLKDLREVPEGSDEHMRLIRPIMARNIAAYKRRRASWSPEFRKFLTGVAKEYLNDSIYVAVSEKGTGEILGGVRFILAPYGVRDGKIVAEGPIVEKYFGPVQEFRSEKKAFSQDGLPLPPPGLPEEVALKVVLDRPAVEHQEAKGGIHGGINIEMGALFVDETLPKAERDRVWGELWLHTLRMAHHSLDDQVNFYGTTIHAYADAASKKLYLPLGFELLRSYEHNGKRVEFGPEIADKDIPPVIKPDGSEWWPIVYHPEKISDFVIHWRDGKVTNRDGSAVPGRLVSLADPRDGEPLAVTAQQMPDLIAGYISDDRRRRHAASYSLNRLVELHGVHLEKEKNSPDAATRLRAKRAREATEVLLRQFPKSLKELGPNLDPDVRAELLILISNFINSSPNRDFFKAPEVMKGYLLPLLHDRDMMVRLTAIHELRNEFRSVESLREALGIADPVAEKRAATEYLHKQGLSDEAIAKVTDSVRKLLVSPLWNKSPGNPDVSYQNSAPVNRLLADLLPYEKKSFKVLRSLIVLSALP